jgi:hypothetical protein
MEENFFLSRIFLLESKNGIGILPPQGKETGFPITCQT